MTGNPLNATAAQIQFPDDAHGSESQASVLQASRPGGGIHETSAPEDVSRASVYTLLGALLRDVPDAALLKHLRSLTPAGGRDGFALAQENLRLAAGRLGLDELDDEYHQLFIGIGRGELVPYGSWYLTGFLMERPLGVLRDDLKALGFERSPGVYEPEDHVAALCEVMSALARDTELPADLNLMRQRAFYRTHMADWIERFWHDLERAESALFYRAVARLGSAFSALETRYLDKGA